MNSLKLIFERFNELDQKTRLRYGIALAVIIALALIYSLTNDRVAHLKKQRTIREAAVAELLQLQQRYKEAVGSSQKVANRLAAVLPDDSPAKAIEETGIKGKGIQIKPLKSEERGGFMEDAAEVKIDAVTSNEAINLLYKIENGSRPMIVRRALFKTRFDDPSKIDLALTIALQKTTTK